MPSLASKLLAVVEASRPLIWLFAIVGAFCGMAMATKGLPPLDLMLLVAIGVGPCVTAATNLLNAACDVEVDKLSKPGRPLPTSRITIKTALAVAFLLYSTGLIVAFTFGFWPFIIAFSGVALSILYSIPQVRIKSVGGVSNFALALGYTTICFLGGWSIFRPPIWFPWLILAFVTLQVSGANVVKDFVDYEGDSQLNIKTLPVRLGVRNTIILILPFIVVIYWTIPLLYLAKYLEWTYLPITLLSFWGLYTLKSLTHDFSRKNREKGFLHAFTMSIFTEAAFVVAYILA